MVLKLEIYPLLSGVDLADVYKLCLRVIFSLTSLTECGRLCVDQSFNDVDLDSLAII